MPPSLMFIYGFFGAFAVDFYEFCEAVNRSGLRHVGVPRKYMHGSYWVLSLIRALIGGFLAMAWAQTYLGSSPMMLIAVGGSARIVIVKFGRVITERIDKEAK